MAISNFYCHIVTQQINMSELLDSISQGRLFGSSSDSYGHCCPPVFDPYTLVALLGGIALATYFLRLVIVTTTFTGRSFGSDFGEYFGLGKFTENPSWMTNILSEILEINEEVNREESDQFRDIKRRSLDTDNSPNILSNVASNSTGAGLPGVCRSEVWSCMSGVMEGGIKYVEQPGDIYTALQPVLYKAVFHGGVKSMWSSVMEVSSNCSMHNS